MENSPRIAVIVVAAGSGTRLGAGEPKAFVELAGQPILSHALAGVFGMSEQAQVIVVAPEGRVPDAARIAEAAAGTAGDSLTVVGGADTRQGSVAAGLAAVDPDIDVVLVHDAARALTPSAQLDAVARSVSELGIGIVPGIPVSDTIKRVDALEKIADTVDRDALRAVQTPQGFPRPMLLRAYAMAAEPLTDDAALVSAAGGTLMVIPGAENAFKITSPWDLRRAELLLSRTGQQRTGIGIDVHAYDPSAELWLAGLRWPGEPGLAGHSDGDAACHAITDALLSAAGLGDIGGLVGTTDPRFAGAHGEVFIAEALRRVTASGYRVVNVAAQIIGSRPRFAARRSEAEAALSRIVGAPVSLSATTTDGLGFTGRGEGVTVIATALLSATSLQAHQ